MSLRQVPLETLNAADKWGFVADLGDIFEQSPWVAEAVFRQRPFATLASLYEAMMHEVSATDPAQQLALITAHPDLAGRAARQGSLSAASQMEQSSTGLDRLSDEEFDTFHRLNNDYRRKFGFPFIICVRRHSKASILQEFARRLQNIREAEIATALSEIFRIAALRLDQRVSALDRLRVHGRLSTHVLDTHSGRPAAGVAVELLELSGGGDDRLIAHATTNADGRTGAALIHQRPVPIGTYELRFAVGDYFARRNVALAAPPFLDIVPVRFSVAEPEGHYHVPLLVTPWGYSTYRGS
jgi:2-oxo-4-hydroxy-4-carboxy-5-ureidoimidazoline decarboxylase